MQTFVEYGLANAVAATALAIFVVLVGMFIRRPAVRNALWILVFVRLLIPSFWTIALPIGSTTSPLEIREIATRPTPNRADELNTEIDVIEFADSNELVDARPEAATEIAAPFDEVAATAPLPVATETQLQPSTIYMWLVSIWIGGSAVFFFRSARRIIRFRRALSDSMPAPDAIQRQADALAKAIGLRSCPRVLVVPGRVWPSLWMPGLFLHRASLILPAGLLPLLDPAQRAAVLAHELSHLRRWDPWVRWLELIACGIYWWHPFLSWFRRKLREAEEECCDMWVVAATGTRRSYATALVETVGFLADSDQSPVPILASGAGPVRKLQRRVTMIMRATWPARLTKFGLAMVLGVSGLALAFGPAMAQPDPKDRPARDKERPDGPPREGDRPRDGDRPKDGDRPREGNRPREGDPRDPRREGERRADNRDIQEAREFLERARKEAHEAMQRLQEAEVRLAKLEGRPVPGPREGGAGRGPGDRGPGDRGDRAPLEPRRPGVGDAPRGGGEFRDLQQQIEDLRRALEEMRREMRRDGGRGPDPRPKDGDRPREGGRPGVNEGGDRPRTPELPTVPKRPGGRE